MDADQDDFDYGAVFADIDREKAEEKEKEDGLTRGELDPDLKLIPLLNEKGRLVAHIDPDAPEKLIYTYVNVDRQKALHIFKEQQRRERIDSARQRVSHQSRYQRPVTFSPDSVLGRRNIMTECIPMEPSVYSYYISTVVTDGEILDELVNNFEIMSINLNGFALVDLLDGKFEDFREFVEKRTQHFRITEK